VTSGTEQKIPLVKEDLEVGKRQTETRYRVRVYTTERPVEEAVTLRDEKVVVERRPVTGRSDGSAPETAPREFDVVERHEQPVATKKARVDEEVVVHKDVRERQEVVRDKVKETKVDVDKSGSGARR
jgi:stress response protein YsnF